jgi:hypothetical protein
VTRRSLIPTAALTFFAVACAASAVPPVDYGSGARFVPLVVETLDDAGQGASAAVSADGTVYVSSFGFAGEVPEGQIAIPRPIGSAFLPAVLLTSVSPEGMVTKGAVQQAKPAVAPAGIQVPFRPETAEGLDLTAANANGSSVAIGSDGSVHVTWTAGRFVSYAKVVTGSGAAVSTVFDYGSALAQAGPIGRPAIALDASGTPWIAFGVSQESRFREIVATPGADGWSLTDLVDTPRCNGCPQPLPSGIAVVGDPAVVVVVHGDPETGDVMASSPDGEAWSATVVEAGALGAGLSLSGAGSAAVAAYVTADGAVHAAAWDGAAWTVSEVATGSAPSATSGLGAPSTGVSLGADGIARVAWQDDTGVHLASGNGGPFSKVETPGTEGGAGPSVAAGPNGNVYLAWYDAGKKNLMVGVLGDAGEVLLANPSPAPTVSLAPVAETSCGDDAKVVLDILAKNTTFVPTCLVAPAGEPFTVNYDNQDAAIPHNFEIYTALGGDKIAGTELAAGPIADPLDVDALDPGNYYFQCVAHPTQMFGTLAVVKGAK